jgi:hypothetical protein
MMDMTFPAAAQLNKRKTIRAPINPLDKATIFSIFPKEIVEVKFTIQPGRFVIPAGTFENPSQLIVGPSSWWAEIDHTQPLLEIPTSAPAIADSVVRDYCNSLLGYSPDNRSPGVFYLAGEVSILELKAKHKELMLGIKERQKNWFVALIDLADALWARSNGNPMVIADDMKLAARELGLEYKDWLKTYTHAELKKCVACGTMITNAVVVCPNCKVVVDVEQFKKLNLQFAS